MDYSINKIKHETGQIIYEVIYDNEIKIFNFSISVSDAMANKGVDFEKLAEKAIKYYVDSKKIDTANEFKLPFVGSGFIVY